MIKWPFPRAAYIDHDKTFRPLMEKLAQEPLLAIDTESNSLYAYRSRVCLIQISTRKTDYILDPLRIADLSPFGVLLANPRIEKIFHAAEYDLVGLKRDYGFELHNLFDTMVAARICGIKGVGLGAMLTNYVSSSIPLDKSHQRDDWGQRPLSESSLLYAQMDTHYLPALRDRLHVELKRRGHLAEALELFEETSTVPLINPEVDPEGYWKIGIPRSLNRRQMAILRRLYLLREELAEELDTPPFKVMNDSVLVAITEANLSSLRDLYYVRGLSDSQVARYGEDIMAAVEAGKEDKAPRPPKPTPPSDPALVERYTTLLDWRKHHARQRGVESDIVISKGALWAIAGRYPHTLHELEGIPGLGPWRLETYGVSLLDALKNMNGK
ncbi:MAG: HRDC domain-containing protein [Anaerolineaceae bacterium]|nr:HRDC domain-containing protein [Anaerolineaceae bacterium]